MFLSAAPSGQFFPHPDQSRRAESAEGGGTVFIALHTLPVFAKVISPPIGVPLQARQLHVEGVATPRGAHVFDAAQGKGDVLAVNTELALGRTLLGPGQMILVGLVHEIRGAPNEKEISHGMVLWQTR